MNKLILPEDPKNKLRMLPALESGGQMQFSPQFQNSPLITPPMIGQRLTRQVPQGFLNEPVDIKVTPELVEKAYKVAEIGGWAGGGLPGMMAEIRAFHGSPYKFDKFKMEKVGTGEGNQAFGHGLYFTNEKDIAKHYAVPKTPSGMRLNEGNVENIKSLIDTGKIDEAKEYALSLNRIYTNNKEYGAANDWAGVYHQLVTDNKLPKWADNSDVYSVTLHKGKKPGEYDYLKWDEVVPKEQLQRIYTKLEKEGVNVNEFKKNIEADWGNRIYQELSWKLGSDREASAFLLRAGIDGIEYPAGTLSGASKKGAKNYVVFDENAITIEEPKLIPPKELKP